MKKVRNVVILIILCMAWIGFMERVGKNTIISVRPIQDDVVASLRKRPTQLELREAPGDQLKDSVADSMAILPIGASRGHIPSSLYGNYAKEVVAPPRGTVEGFLLRRSNPGDSMPAPVLSPSGPEGR